MHENRRKCGMIGNPERFQNNKHYLLFNLPIDVKNYYIGNLPSPGEKDKLPGYFTLSDALIPVTWLLWAFGENCCTLSRRLAFLCNMAY